MRHWLETDEIGRRRRRIENINLQRRISFDVERYFALKPKDARATFPSEKGVVDPPARQGALRGKIPLRTRGSLSRVRRKVIVRFEDDALRFGLQKCRARPDDPGMKT
jgi:hypothetical protein